MKKFIIAILILLTVVFVAACAGKDIFVPQSDDNSTTHSASPSDGNVDLPRIRV